MKYLKYIILILPALVMLEAFAQEEDCAFKLVEAQQLYDAGRIENIPEMLQSCIERGFTQEERLSAFKLIILCQIYDDDLDKAHEGMLSFLKRYPEYELSPTDPNEFRFIFEQYRTRPILDLGAFAGVSRTHGTISQPVIPFNLDDFKPRYVSDGFAFQAGALINFYASSQIQISLEPMYAQSNFQLVYEEEPIDGINLDHLKDFLHDRGPFSRFCHLYRPRPPCRRPVVDPGRRLHLPRRLRRRPRRHPSAASSCP